MSRVYYDLAQVDCTCMGADYTHTENSRLFLSRKNAGVAAEPTRNQSKEAHDDNHQKPFKRSLRKEKAILQSRADITPLQSQSSQVFALRKGETNKETLKAPSESRRYASLHKTLLKEEEDKTGFCSNLLKTPFKCTNLPLQFQDKNTRLSVPMKQERQNQRNTEPQFISSIQSIPETYEQAQRRSVIMFNAAKVAQPEPLLAPQAVFEQHLKQQRFTGPIRQVVYAPHINQPMPQPISQIHTQPMSQIHPQLSQQTNQQIRSPRNQTKYQKMVKQANDNQNQLGRQSESLSPEKLNQKSLNIEGFQKVLRRQESSPMGSGKILAASSLSSKRPNRQTQRNKYKETVIIPKLVCSENGSDECHSEVIGNDFGEGYQTDSKWRDYDCGRMETIASSNAKLSQEQGRLSQLDRFPNSLQKKSFQNIELGKQHF